MKNITIIFLCLSLNSCSLLITHKILFGVRTPCVQSQKNMEKVLHKYDILKPTYTLNQASYIQKISQPTNYFSKWEIYDKNGFQLFPLDSNLSRCIGNIHLFVQNLPNNSFYIDSSNIIFNDSAISTGLVSLDNRKEQTIQDLQFDYLLVIYWSTFMGKYSSDLLKLNKIASENKHSTIFSLIINMDFKEEYGVTKKEAKSMIKWKKN